MDFGSCVSRIPDRFCVCLAVVVEEEDFHYHRGKGHTISHFNLHYNNAPRNCTVIIKDFTHLV